MILDVLLCFFPTSFSSKIDLTRATWMLPSLVFFKVTGEELMIPETASTEKVIGL